jgi:hypothetical protein
MLTLILIRIETQLSNAALVLKKVWNGYALHASYQRFFFF